MIFDRQIKNLAKIAERNNGDITFEELVKHDFVTNDANAIITVRLDTENQLYSEFSDKDLLNPKIIDYINTIARLIPSFYPLTIKFITKDGSKIDEVKLKKLLKKHYWMLYTKKEAKLKKDSWYAVGLAAVGMMLLFFYQYMVSNNIDIIHQALNISFFEEFTLIIAWLFLWEATRHFFIGRNDRVDDMENDEQIASAILAFEEQQTEGEAK
jgi:succinate dehydrogenase hydrophobic anchor subunit